jgi:hypothetical protein
MRASRSLLWPLALASCVSPVAQVPPPSAERVSAPPVAKAAAVERRRLASAFSEIVRQGYPALPDKTAEILRIAGFAAWEERSYRDSSRFFEPRDAATGFEGLAIEAGPPVRLAFLLRPGYCPTLPEVEEAFGGHFEKWQMLTPHGDGHYDVVSLRMTTRTGREAFVSYEDGGCALRVLMNWSGE